MKTWSGELTEPPVAARARVLAVSDGRVEMHGPMTAGATMQLGPSACVEVEGIRVLLASAKAQMLDLDLYRYLGVEPARMKLLVNKSSVHFRAAFAPIASAHPDREIAGPDGRADPGDPAVDEAARRDGDAAVDGPTARGADRSVLNPVDGAP